MSAPITARLTFADVEAICRARRTAKAPAGSGTSSFDNAPSASWDDGIGFDAVPSYLAAGWDAGNEAIAHVMDVTDAETAPTGGWDLEMAGQFVCVPALLAGDPECMYVMDPGEAPRRVRLVVSSGFSCFIDAASAMEYAKACAAYAVGLMAKGLDVAVTSLQAIEASGVTSLLAIDVKQYGQEPDASRIAFSVHPAFLRRALFAVEEMNGALPPSHRASGYGTPCFDTTRGKEYAVACYGADSADERVITLPPLTGNGQSMAKLLKAWESQAVDSQYNRDAIETDKQAGAL